MPFDPVSYALARRLSRRVPVLVATVETDFDGLAEVRFPAPMAGKPLVVATSDTDGVVASVYEWVTDAHGNYVGVRLVARVLTPELVKFSYPLVYDLTKSTESVVSDIGSDTGWGTDPSGYLRHTHTKTTTTVLRDVSKRTTYALLNAFAENPRAPYVTLYVAVYPPIGRAPGGPGGEVPEVPR